MHEGQMVVVAEADAGTYQAPLRRFPAEWKPILRPDMSRVKFVPHESKPTE